MAGMISMRVDSSSRVQGRYNALARSPRQQGGGYKGAHRANWDNGYLYILISPGGINI